MSRKDQGNALSIPVLKPNTTRFVLTQEGFDTGQRTFTIDENYLERALPELDSADTDIQFQDHLGTRRGGYRTMYVSGVSDITELANGLREFTITYQGLIQRAKRAYETVQTSVTTVNGGGFSFYYSTPSVTLTKVVNAKPDPTDLGTIIVPPGWDKTLKRSTIKGVTFDPPSFAQWIMKERDTRQCGPLFEAREQYTYEVIQPQSS